ncbi:MAG: hypothetical protein ACM3UU_00840 [Ignavibacteriales bacterium]
MKAIEKMSPSLEKILTAGLEKSESTLKIPLFQASINLYYFESSLFVLYSKEDSYTKKKVVSLFEIKNNESSFLFNTMNQIIDDLDRFGEDEKRKETFEVFSNVLSFCKKISFDCTDFEIALKKLE